MPRSVSSDQSALPATVADVITRHACRDFGSSGFREVALDVFSTDELVFSYKIVHLWKVEERYCSSLYFLTEPAVLAGTAVKVVEQPYAKDIEIWLRLRSATHAIRVDSSRSDQLVLGTDFTYEDLRFWLPTDALDISRVEFGSAEGKGEYTLSARRRSGGLGHSEMRLTLDATQWLPIRIEWRELNAEAPHRIYSAKDLVCVDGVWTPGVISVCRPREQYKSVMTLRRALHRVPIEPELFRTDQLPSLSKSALEGWIKRAHEFSRSES